MGAFLFLKTRCDGPREEAGTEESPDVGRGVTQKLKLGENYHLVKV